MESFEFITSIITPATRFNPYIMAHTEALIQLETLQAGLRAHLGGQKAQEEEEDMGGAIPPTTCRVRTL